MTDNQIKLRMTLVKKRTTTLNIAEPYRVSVLQALLQTTQPTLFKFQHWNQEGVEARLIWHIYRLEKMEPELSPATGKPFYSEDTYRLIPVGEQKIPNFSCGVIGTLYDQDDQPILENVRWFVGEPMDILKLK